MSSLPSKALEFFIRVVFCIERNSLDQRGRGEGGGYLNTISCLGILYVFPARSKQLECLHGTTYTHICLYSTVYFSRMPAICMQPSSARLYIHIHIPMILIVGTADSDSANSLHISLLYSFFWPRDQPVDD